MKLRNLLVNAGPGKSVGESQRDSGNAFWRIVDAAGIRKWSKGDAPPRTGTYVLIGLAPSYSVPDLELADAVVEKVLNGSAGAKVEFFDTSDIRTPQEIEQCVPDIGIVFQTPVVGVWRDGTLVDKASGFAGRRLVRRALFGDT
jgi:hypothetical protein